MGRRSLPNVKSKYNMFRKLFYIVTMSGLLGAAVLVAFFYVTPSALPEATSWPVSPALLDREARLFHTRLSEAQEYCLPVPLEAMGRWLPMLAVEVEDRRFYSHAGVDFLALGRALGQNLLSGRRVSGASTITSQLVRISLPRERSLATKAREFVQAVDLERKLDKERILELYLNRAPLGGPFRGVEAGARGYFGKSARDLTLSEAALLVAMFKGPTFYRPDLNPKGLLERRDFILQSLAERGRISEDRLRLARLETLPPGQAALPAEHRHFADRTLAALPADYWLKGGSPVHSSLDPQAQRLLNQALMENLTAFPPSVTGAGIIVDNKSGAVLAYSGNARFDPAGGKHWVDCGAAGRSPGSALKPFIYLEALEQGLLVPGSMLADTPLSFGGSAPRNFDRLYRGPVPARQALADSLNAPAVRVLRLAGGESALHRLRGLGFGQIRQNAAHYGDSLVLGGCEVSLLELAQAYTVLANFGAARRLSFISAAQNPESQLFTPRPFRAGAAPDFPGLKNMETGRYFSAPAGYLVTGMLADMGRFPFGQRETLTQQGRRAALKTGTSYGLRDAWACSYTPEHTVIVWHGNEDGAPDENLVGISGAAPAALRVLRDIPMREPRRWFARPAGVETFTACALSGKPAAPFCPQIVIGERIAGLSQTVPCNLHRENRDGLLTILPPELEEYARLRSLASSRKSAIDITSPRAKARFYLNPAAPEQKINLACEGAAGQVYWFINREFYAAQEAGRPLLWPMRGGAFTVSLIDSEGRSAASSFEVLDVTAREAVPLNFGR